MSTVLITGCSSGFGYQAARSLASRGHHVFATMRDPEGRNREVGDELMAFAEEEDLDLRVLALDVTRQHAVDAAIRQALAEVDALDAVINNAGRTYFGVTEAYTPEELQGQLNVNLVGPFRMARAVLPHMRERGEGLLLNVSSIVGRLALPFFGFFQASQWGLEGMTESLHYELSPFGVDVVLLELGPFARRFHRSDERVVDAERAAACSDELDLVRGRVQSAFDALFDDPDAPTDPELAVEALVELVEAEPGERPLRTVAGADFGVRELNDALESLRKAALEAMNLEHLDRVGSRPS